VLGLLVLAPLCAEDLAAYDDSTGDPAALLLGLLVLAPLYGAPALLVREAARRANLGWVGMILLAAAFGLLQAGVIDQSLFSADYRDIASWEESLRSTYIAPLGLGAYMTQSFLVGHVIFSFCAPIALVEGFRPGHRTEPWVGRLGLVVAGASYLAIAALVLGDHLAGESSHASAAQVAGSLVIACGLIAGAFVLGRRIRPGSHRRAPRSRVVFIAGLVAVTALTVVPENWLGFAAAVGLLALGGGLLARVSRAPGWGARHAVALAAGAVLSRAVLAFTYYPVIGEVSATRKYLHNLALLAIIGAVALLAARRSVVGEGQLRVVGALGLDGVDHGVGTAPGEGAAGVLHREPVGDLEGALAVDALGDPAA
jgi:hypothetical protein